MPANKTILIRNSQRGLALFFTLGVSLDDWQKAGYLWREVSYYQRLAECIGPITFITYGAEEDRALGETLDGIRVLNNPNQWSPKEFAQRAPEIYRDELRGVAVIKSNQLKGAQAAIRAAALTHAQPILRCDYLSSRFVLNKPIPARSRFRLWRRELMLFHRAARVFLPTQEDATYVQRWYALPGSKVNVIPGFVDTELFAPQVDVACEPGLVGFMGRLGPRENLSALVNAVSRLRGVRLRLIGDGPERDALFTLATEKNVSVEILGSVQHQKLPRLLAECEVIVFPSFYKQLSKPLLEGMAAGVPVLATGVRGVESLIKHRQTGWVCEDASHECLRHGLETLLYDSRLRTQIGRSGREYVVKHFSLDTVLEKEIAVYQEMALA